MAAASSRYRYIWVEAYQIRGKLAELVVSSGGVTLFDSEVLVFNISERGQAASECSRTRSQPARTTGRLALGFNLHYLRSAQHGAACLRACRLDRFVTTRRSP